MKNLVDYEAYQQLMQLGKNPPDLTKEGVVTPERIASYYASNCGYKLLYATERVDDRVIGTLNSLAQEAKLIDRMKEMQAGKKINVIEGFPSEDRAVLHTATRDFFDHPNQSPEAVAATKLALAEVDKLRSFIDKLDSENKITDLIMVAIGGSDLGPRAHYYALEYLKKPNRNVHFISNIDPDDVAAVLNKVDLAKSLVVVVSKSGSTIETLTNSALIKERYIEEGINPREHFVSVTMKGSLIDREDEFFERFYMWDWVGGRYSTCSMCGGVMLSFAFGFETYWEMLKGAHDMDRASLSADLKTNLPLLGALLSIWNHNVLGMPTLAIIPYSQSLHRYPAHIQQVEMESNGKHINKQGQPISYQTGMVIWGEPGTNAQHSFYQLIHQGTQIIPIEFVGFKDCLYGKDLEVDGTTSQQKLLSNLFAQAICLATGKQNTNPNKVFEGNRPSHILLGKKLTPHALGALLSYFENKVVFEGFLWNVNSFDQEGVQLGKVTATSLIDRFIEKNGKSNKAPYPLGDAFIQHL